MEAVQPVAHFMRSGPSQVGRSRGRPHGPKRGEGDDQTIGGRWSSRELCIPEIIPPEITDPDVEVSITGPWIRTAGARRLHPRIQCIWTVLVERRHRCPGASHSVREAPVGITPGAVERDVRMTDQGLEGRR